MSDVGNWCLIESDPGVFTELIKGFGVNGVQVEELYTLDDEQFEDLKPVYGLIFLFKWRPEEEPSGRFDGDTKDIFFAQQVIPNACATQAIVNLLLNCDQEGLELGKTLHDFRSFSIGFDPPNRGLCLSNSEEIRKVHNSFAREHFVELDTPKSGKEDNYHFVTYVPFNGHVYELDGLREGPIDLGPINEKEGWIATVKPIISKRIETFSAGEIHFNLMAVVADRKAKYEKRLAELLEMGMDSETVAEEVAHLQAKIGEEEDKHIRYHKENVRRRHNYTPFIVELLKILAKEGKLVSLIEKGVEEAEKRSIDKAKA